MLTVGNLGLIGLVLVAMFLWRKQIGDRLSARAEADRKVGALADRMGDAIESWHQHSVVMESLGSEAVGELRKARANGHDDDADHARH